MKTSYTKNMSESLQDTVQQPVVPKTLNQNSSGVPGNAYFKLRKIALILTVVLIVIVLISLLYLNGKSLYDNGL